MHRLLGLIIIVLSTVGYVLSGIELANGPVIGLVSLDPRLPLEPSRIAYYTATSDCCEGWHPVTQSFRYDFFAAVNTSMMSKQLHGSLTSVMETLEDVRAMVDEVRMLVETLHHTVQAFVSMFNEVAMWFNQFNGNTGIRGGS